MSLCTICRRHYKRGEYADHRLSILHRVAVRRIDAEAARSR